MQLEIMWEETLDDALTFEEAWEKSNSGQHDLGIARFANADMDCSRATVNISELQKEIRANDSLRGEYIFPYKLTRVNNQTVDSYVLSNNLEYYFKVEGDLAEKSTYELLVIPILTSDKRLHLLIDRLDIISERITDMKAKMSDVKTVRSGYYFEVLVKNGGLFSESFEQLNVVFRDRTDFRKIPLMLIRSRVSGDNLRLLLFLDTKVSAFQPLYYDFFIDFTSNLTVARKWRIQVRAADCLLVWKLRWNINNYQKKDDEGYVISPYITTNKSVSLIYRPIVEIDSKTQVFKERTMMWIAWLLKPITRKLGVWIFFEKNANSAHDNAFWLYRWVRENVPTQRIFYVIKDTSPEYQNLMKSDLKEKVLIFNSFAYMFWMFSAELLISSDTKYHSYSLHQKGTPLGRSLRKKRAVFLQHGVNGFKYVPNFYKSRGLIDLIVSTNPIERSIILNEWGYSEDEIIDAGLARWDGYENQAHTISKKQILLMPTWRTNLEDVTKHTFKDSTYFNVYHKLLSDPELSRILKEKNAEVLFYLHPVFRKYSELFDDAVSGVHVLDYLSDNLTESILSSSILISDYSSVIWDFFRMQKPVLLFQFDLDNYLATEGTYLDFNDDLVGPSFERIDELLPALEKTLDSQFELDNKYTNLASKLFQSYDSISATLYEAILRKQALLRIGPYRRGLLTEVVRATLLKIRKLFLMLRNL